MKAGKYSVKELFVNRYIDRIVVPEIQRDYVWQSTQVKGLLDSILTDYEKFNDAIVPFAVEDRELERDFLQFYRRRNYSSSIGFIYAYNDEELPGNYYLIDGQQRITTIYLTLLALANMVEDLRDSFKKTYLGEGTPRLDYRVRENSHDFLCHFVPFKLAGGTDVTNQKWFLKEYSNDVTLSNLQNNFDVIRTYLHDDDINKTSLYKYLEDYTECWYFDTNVSQQGEELYIYMNARGEQVESNENIKADLLGKLSTISEKNEFGRQWEDWQDFFWKHRGDNPNADLGFNQFLECIAGLERMKTTGDKGPIQPTDFVKYLDLYKVAAYIKALKFINEQKPLMIALYPYYGWIDKCVNDCWNIFNKQKTNWFANYDEENRGVERSRMVFIWGYLLFATRIETSTERATDLFRGLRIFYLRFKNYNRSVSSLIKSVSELVENGLFVERPIPGQGNGRVPRVVNPEALTRLREEALKGDLFSKIEDDGLLRNMESCIWQIEDHPLNIDGRDVGALNCSHLIDFGANPSLTELEKVRQRFYDLFSGGSYRILQNCLLYYGRSWYVETPTYYENLHFGDWKRLIRSRYDGMSNKSVSAFGAFWKEYIDYDGTLEDLLSKHSQIAIEFDHNNEQDLSKILIWYNRQLGNKMWAQGNYIAISYGDPCSLPDWGGDDRAFPKVYMLYNTKGHLNGGIKQELAKLLPESTLAAINLT